MSILKRLSFDLILFSILLTILATHSYEYFSVPIANIIQKATNVSNAVLHATVTRRLLFNKVDWEGAINAKVLAAVVLYAMFIFAYAIGS